MPVDAGDVVLSAIIDLSQPNAALDQLSTNVTTKLGQPRDELGRFTNAFGATGAAAQAAANDASALDERFLNLGRSVSGVKQPLDDAGKGAELSAKQMREARGEAGLLGELFGIHLPRHVRTFLAEIPGVGIALQGAFAATAVIFLIEALVKGIEKIDEWAHH